MQSGSADQAERPGGGQPAGQGVRNGPSVTIAAEPAQHDPAGVRHGPSAAHGLPRRQLDDVRSGLREDRPQTTAQGNDNNINNIVML